jgi:hypothetical protein
VIFSLAFNFWAPDGVQFTNRLIDASLTKHVILCDEEKKAGDSTWYFVIKENEGLQNSFQTEVSPYYDRLLIHAVSMILTAQIESGSPRCMGHQDSISG